MINAKRWICIVLYVGTLCWLLTGCAATKTSIWYPDCEGVMKKVVEIKQDSPGSVTYKPETKEVIVDSRKPNLWQENILPMVTGVVNTASRGR